MHCGNHLRWGCRHYITDYVLLAAVIVVLCFSEFSDPFERSVYHKSDAVRPDNPLSGRLFCGLYSSALHLFMDNLLPCPVFYTHFLDFATDIL